MISPPAGLGAHLPALQVVIPLIAAPLCVVVRRAAPAWLLASVVSWTALAIAALLLAEVVQGGTIVYALGGWAAPWGIEYRIDEANGLVLVIIAAISSVTLLFARDSVEREVNASRVNLLYTAWMLSLTGMLGIVITGDAFNVFVFLEIASLSSYVLVSVGRDRRALLAAFRYLVMGTIGATFILIGIGLLYALTGTLNMADLAARIPEVADRTALRAAFAFVFVGAALKVALFPLHAWLPNAYTYAPSVVSAFLAGTATKVALYVMLRFFLTIFGARLSFDVLGLGLVLLPLALAGVVVGSAVAIFQTDAKRLLAYSSIAQIGYMALGVSFATQTGITAGLTHLFNHALMKSALFLAVGCVVMRTGSSAIESFAGLGRRMPLTMASIVVAGASLVGVPFTAGFVSKWMLLTGALELGMWPVAALVVASSLLAVVYVGRILEVAYFRPAAEGSVQTRVSEAPASFIVPLWMLTLANLYFGVHTEVTVGVARRAAAALLGGGG